MIQATALVLALTLLNPVRTYFQPSHPVMVTLDAAALAKLPGVPGVDKGPYKLVLLDPDGKSMAQAPVDPAKPEIDLMTAFAPAGGGPNPIWNGKTWFVQLVAGKQPVGSPLVIVPLLTPTALDAQGNVVGRPMPPGMPPNALRIEPEKLVEFDTALGKILIRLDPVAAPNTCVHFAMLVAGGFYTDVKFHRVVPGFVIQGGDPTGSGRGGPGYTLNLEAGDKPHNRGTLSMARQGDNVNSSGSQFFICLNRDACAALDHKYSAFGDVVSGMAVVDKIAAGELEGNPQNGQPKNPVVIREARLIPAPPRPIDAPPAGDA